MRKPLNNKGFTLIELLIAVAILAIVSIAIYGFALAASRNYQKQVLEVELQYEAQLAMNQLQDLLIDATEGVTYRVNGAQNIISDADIAGAEVNGKELIVYNEDTYYVIKWNPAARTLLYSEHQRQSGENPGEYTWSEVAGNELMAEYVADFSADLVDMETSRIIKLKVLFNNDREYEVAQNVTLRNKVLVNATPNQIYGE